MKIKSAIISAVSLTVGIAGLFFIMEAEKQKNKTDELIAMTSGNMEPQAKKKIWIGAEECKTTFGPNTIAFCDGVSKDNSMFLDSGADQAVQECFEYVAGKMGLSISEAHNIACEVKAAYIDRQFEYDMEKDIAGIKNSNYTILNEWVNQ